MSRLLQFDANATLYCRTELCILDSPYNFQETVARLYALASYDIFKKTDRINDSFQVRGYFDNSVFVLKDHRCDEKIHIYADSDLNMDWFLKHLTDLMAKVEPKPYQAQYHYTNSESYYYPPLEQ